MNFQVESVKDIIVYDSETGEALFKISGEGLEKGKEYNKEVGTIGGWTIGDDKYTTALKVLLERIRERQRDQED